MASRQHRPPRTPLAPSYPAWRILRAFMRTRLALYAAAASGIALLLAAVLFALARGT
jgi:hypothetical protein